MDNVPSKPRTTMKEKGNRNRDKLKAQSQPPVLIRSITKLRKLNLTFNSPLVDQNLSLKLDKRTTKPPQDGRTGSLEDIAMGKLSSNSKEIHPAHTVNDGKY